MNKRRNYFVKKRFQTNFFVKFTVLLLLEAVLIGGLFMHVSRGTLTTSYDGSELTIQPTDAYFFVSFILICLIVGVAIGLTGKFVFLFLSHRVGGPIYRFERTVEEAKRGNIAQRVRLRKTDLLFELREEMNAFLGEMDIRISDIKGDIAKALQLLKTRNNEGDHVKLKRILEKIQSSLDHFRTSK